MFSTIRQKWILFLERIKREFVNSDEVFYIGGTDVLPPPLEKTQENMCIIALSNDRKNESVYTRDEAREQLISHNLRLVVYLAKKFENTGVLVEDLISIGAIGLVKGINTFDPVKNSRLAAYAARCVEKTILSQRLSWVI